MNKNSKWRRWKKSETRQDTKTPSENVKINHPNELIVGDKDVGVETRSIKMIKVFEEVNYALLLRIELSCFKEVSHEH